jgi:DNA polymerase/3'-5' exonuclease PolX
LRLEDARVLANRVLDAIAPLVDWAEVAGSIRRERPEVNDIDIVAIPKTLTRSTPLSPVVYVGESIVWQQIIPDTLMKKLGLVDHQRGQELLRLSFPENRFPVDIYRARDETWGVIFLIRTGSKEHNVKLCSLARSKGLKLSARQGLVTQGGFGQIIASKTEEEIFAALGLGYVEPKDREV